MGLFWGSSLPKSVIFNTAKTLFPGIVLLKLTHKVNAFYFTTQHTYPLCCYCSVAQSCLTLCIPMGYSTLGFPVFHHLPNLLKLSSIKSVMPPNHLILCCPLLLLPSVFPSISVFSNESALCIRWPKYWSFSFSIIPLNEHSGLISCRSDWFDLAVQGTLKSLLHHHSSKASILWRSAFFIGHSDSFRQVGASHVVFSSSV